MKAFRQVGVVILLLASYLTPAMACMISDAQMNAAERACCRMMDNRCEQMGMPASHGCCQKVPRSGRDKAVLAKATQDCPVAAEVAGLIDRLHPWVVSTQRVSPLDDDSPPQFPPGSNSVLRI